MLQIINADDSLTTHKRALVEELKECNRLSDSIMADEQNGLSPSQRKLDRLQFHVNAAKLLESLIAQRSKA